MKMATISFRAFGRSFCVPLIAFTWVKTNVTLHCGAGQGSSPAIYKWPSYRINYTTKDHGFSYGSVDQVLATFCGDNPGVSLSDEKLRAILRYLNISPEVHRTVPNPNTNFTPSKKRVSIRVQGA